MFETETVVPCLVQKLKWGAMAPLVPPVATPRQSVTKLTLLDVLWFKSGTSDDQRYIPIHVLSSELGLPICRWFSAMHAGCDSVSSFTYIRKIATFQTLKNKIDELKNKIGYGDFSHSL